MPQETEAPTDECVVCGKETVYAHHCADCWEALYDAPEPDDYPCPGCGRMIVYDDICPDCYPYDGEPFAVDF